MPLVYANSLSSTGTNTYTQDAVANVTWNLTSLETSFKGPSRGPNARLTVYDGAVGDTIIYRCFLDQPTGSVGMVQKINLPTNALGQIGLQGTPGNAMTIVVDGFGDNQSSINARFTDGLP